MYRGILARFQNFSVCVLVFVFVFLYLYVLHPGAVPQWSLYPGLSKNIAHVWSIVSFYFRARINLLRGEGRGGPKPIVNIARRLYWLNDRGRCWKMLGVVNLRPVREQLQLQGHRQKKLQRNFSAKIQKNKIYKYTNLQIYKYTKNKAWRAATGQPARERLLPTCAA